MRGLKVVLTSLAVLLLSALPASAQRDGLRRWDLTLGGGTTWSSNWSNLVVLTTTGGQVERILTRGVHVAPGLLADFTVTYWEGRYGFRAHGAWSQSCLSIGQKCVASQLTPEQRATLKLPNSNIQMNDFMADIGGVVNLVEPKAHQTARPYIFFGAGALAYGPGDQVLNLLPTFISVGGVPGVVAFDTARQTTVVLDQSTLTNVPELGLQTKLQGYLGFGTDLRFKVGNGGFGLRLEASDHITKSPLSVEFASFPIAGGVNSGIVNFGGVTRPEEVKFKFGPVHNLRFAAGLVFEFGLKKLPPRDDDF